MRAIFKKFGSTLFLLLLPATRAMEGSDEPDFIEKSLAVMVRYEQQILREGRPLNPSERELARAVGVRYPERVRVMIVAGIPGLEDADLEKSWSELGIRLEEALGLTVGRGIFLVGESSGNVRVLIHELTHVTQYERLGGIRPFLEVYLTQLRRFGYRRAPLEAEAFRNMERFTRR